MRSVALTFLFCGLISSPLSARSALSSETRANFRKAVGEYQSFITPICPPKIVQTYVAARSERDAKFVRSLKGSRLASEYRRALHDYADKERHTFHECSLPPPPPPPPPGYVPPRKVQPEQPAPGPIKEHFEGGDKQFAKMVQLRDSLIGPSDR